MHNITPPLSQTPHTHACKSAYTLAHSITVVATVWGGGLGGDLCLRDAFNLAECAFPSGK